ncbi:unnamed protein product [Cochlearia groenlandica]
MAAFEYPKLSRPEIITVLREFQIATVTDADLRNPNSDFVFDIFTRLLIYLDVINEEDKGQVAFEALEQLENPDDHITSVKYMNLYIKVKEVLDLMDCPTEINCKDLIMPQSSRNEFFIGALLNYALYRDSKMELIKPNAEELSLLVEQQNQLDDKIAQVNAEIAEYDEASERDLPCVQELEANIEELKQRISELNNQQLSLRTTFKEMKEKSTQMDNKISKAEFDLVQTVQENANLRSQIVQSPDKLQAALEEKKQLLAETKKAEVAAMKSYQEKAATLEVYQKAFKKMSKSSALLQQINEQATQVKAIEKDLKAQKAKLSEDEAVYNSLEAQVAEGERKVEELQGTLKQLEEEKGAVSRDCAEQLNELKAEVESKRRDLEDRQTYVESLLAMVVANTAKTKQVKQSGEYKVNQIASKYEEIVKQFGVYTASFGELLPKDMD